MVEQLDSDEIIHFWPDTTEPAACGLNITTAPYTYGSDRPGSVTCPPCRSALRAARTRAQVAQASPEPKRFRYYVGWMSANEYGQIGYGGTDISRNEPIRGMDDVRGLTEFLRGHYDDPKLAVTSFSRFDD